MIRSIIREFKIFNVFKICRISVLIRSFLTRKKFILDCLTKEIMKKLIKLINCFNKDKFTKLFIVMISI